VQLVQIPPQLLELDAEDFSDAAASFERRDDPKPPEPIVVRERSEPFLLARLEATFSLEFAELVYALCRILGGVLAFDGPVVEPASSEL